MYQNLPGYYPYNTPYQTQYMQQPQTPIMTQSQNFLRGRPVVSYEEARAAQIDLDGSVFIFTDLANKKIYTKQITQDGTAAINTYSLVQNAEAAPDYITRVQFEKALAQLREKKASF